MPEIYQMTVVGTTPSGNYWATVWHWLYTPAGTPLVGVSAAKDVVTWFSLTGGAAYQDILPMDTGIGNCSAKRVSTGGGPTWSQPFTHTGTRMGSVQAAGVCPDIAWYPGAAPWKIGHTYVPGVTSDDLDEGLYSDGIRNAIDTFCGIITADTNVTTSGATLQFVLYNAALNTFAVVINGTLRPKPTLMNRRLKPVTT